MYVQRVVSNYGPVLHDSVVLLIVTIFLNQARAWFLKITSVRMCVCVCVSAPGLLKTIHEK